MHTVQANVAKCLLMGESCKLKSTVQTKTTCRVSWDKWFVVYWHYTNKIDLTFILYAGIDRSKHWLPWLLVANTNSSPVLQSRCCLSALVPCSSWTLLTQHWPCCIVSPCSSWIGPAPSSSPVREVPFPQCLTTYFGLFVFRCYFNSVPGCYLPVHSHWCF